MATAMGIAPEPDEEKQIMSILGLLSIAAIVFVVAPVLIAQCIYHGGRDD